VAVQRLEILRKREDLVARLDAPFLSEPAERATFDDLAQLGEMLAELLSRIAFRRDGNGETPDLIAFRRPEVGKDLDEARQEVALGEQNVDGSQRLEFVHHLVDARSDFTRTREHLFGMGIREVR